MKKSMTLLIALVLSLLCLHCTPGQATAAPPGNSKSNINTPPPDVDQVIAKAQQSDQGFDSRRNTLAQSKAFVEVLQETTPNFSRSLDYFAAISTEQQAKDLVVRTAGKHYVIEGDLDNPRVYLADGEPEQGTGIFSQKRSITPNAMPRCRRAWAAFAAWLTGTTMICAPFSGPAAWSCAAAMGFLGLMPDFNKACKKSRSGH